MAEPDELYTLRAQFHLGHYELCLNEAKNLSRRPLSAELKAETEEFVRRAETLLQRPISAAPGESPALQALALKAQYEQSFDASLYDQLKSLASMHSSDAVVQRTVAQTQLSTEPLAAYAKITDDNSPEGLAIKIQILLRLHRLDLAQRTLQQFSRLHEEAVLLELSLVYVNLFVGAKQAQDAEHTLNALVEQYGPSSYLSNLLAAATALQQDYAASETRLSEDTTPESLINKLCVHQHLGTADPKLLEQLGTSRKTDATKWFLEGLGNIETAFQREAAKYKH